MVAPCPMIEKNEETSAARKTHRKAFVVLACGELAILAKVLSRGFVTASIQIWNMEDGGAAGSGGGTGSGTLGVSFMMAILLCWWVVYLVLCSTLGAQLQ